MVKYKLVIKMSMNIDYEILVKGEGFMNIHGYSDIVHITPYERSSIERCKSVFKDNVVFDLGCAGGLWSWAALQAGASKVICFDQSNYSAEIIRNLSAFGQDRFRFVHARITGNNDGGVNPPTITLDKWIEENKIDPGFIKMDIEGSEWDAIDGMKDTIKRLGVADTLNLMIEVHSNERNRVDELINKIKNYGMQKGCSGINLIHYHIHHIYYLPGGV